MVIKPEVADRVKHRACDGKKRYSPRDATSQAEVLRDKGERVSPYRCNFCGYWHVGHVMSMASVELLASVIRERRG